MEAVLRMVLTILKNNNNVNVTVHFNITAIHLALGKHKQSMIWLHKLITKGVSTSKIFDLFIFDPSKNRAYWLK